MHALVLFLSSYYQQHVSIGSSRLQASEISTSLERGVAAVVQVNTVYKLHDFTLCPDSFTAVVCPHTRRTCDAPLTAVGYTRAHTEM